MMSPTTITDRGSSSRAEICSWRVAPESRSSDAGMSSGEMCLIIAVNGDVAEERQTSFRIASVSIELSITTSSAMSSGLLQLRHVPVRQLASPETIQHFCPGGRSAQAGCLGCQRFPGGLPDDRLY